MPAVTTTPTLAERRAPRECHRCIAVRRPARSYLAANVGDVHNQGAARLAGESSHNLLCSCDPSRICVKQMGSDVWRPLDDTF